MAAWFKIPTPLGTYNPDWAVMIEKDGTEKLYFVVETKGADMFGRLPPEQQAKIKCGKAHFKALGEERVQYIGPVDNYSRFDDLANSMK